MESQPQITIPFNKPTFIGTEEAFVRDAFRRGQISGDGHYSKLCQDLLERELGVAKVLLTTSCTHALEMTALLLNLGPDDEVIVPSFTFVSTANAFAMRGARVVFADVRPDTLNLDESKLESLITDRTRAVVVVHYAGIGCEMDQINQVAERHGLLVVEDNAHGLFGTYRNRYLGSLGGLATLSFHETKNFNCGEGGALLINDTGFIERAEIIRDKGTNRSRFFRGEVDKYTWVDLGSSYPPSDVLAAILYSQLESRHRILEARRRVWHLYDDLLDDWARTSGVVVPRIPAHCEQSYHSYFLLLPTAADRHGLITHLMRHGIRGVFHYQPLHLSEMGQRYGGKAGDCPVTEDVSDRLVRLPFYNDLTEADQGHVVETVRDYKTS